MQLFALDSQDQLTSALKADKSQDYFCFECQGIVRRRGGPHRQPHFFHLGQTAHCHLSGKGMAHLQIQCRLAELLGESVLEQRFPSIGRIADVAWISEGLIFEVQCSPISAEEIAARNSAYATLGFQVVWILHDRQFNQRKVSSAESFLADSIHYFSNMNANGQGIIYDQFDIKKRGRRLKKLPPLPVDLSQPMKHESREIRTKWPLYFSGDLIDLHRRGSSRYLDEMKFLQSVPKITLGRRCLGLFEKWVSRPYRLLFQMLLERSCR